MSRRVMAGSALLASLLLAGCSSDPSSQTSRLFCDPFPDSHAIVIKVFDAQNGKPLELHAGGFVRDGSYYERFERKGFEDPNQGTQRIQTLVAAKERPGTYSIEVRREGYKPWQADGITVSTDACGSVNTMLFTVYLEPEPKS